MELLEDEMSVCGEFARTGYYGPLHYLVQIVKMVECSFQRSQRLFAPELPRRARTCQALKRPCTEALYLFLQKTDSYIRTQVYIYHKNKSWHIYTYIMPSLSIQCGLLAIWKN